MLSIDSILISEFAQATPDGRLSVSGTFNGITSSGFPALVQSLYLSLVIHGHPKERGSEHELQLKILNADRENLVEEGKGLTRFRFVDAQPDPGMPLRHVHVTKLSMGFPAPGPYSFEVYVDGIFCAATNFSVKKSAEGDE